MKHNRIWLLLTLVALSLFALSFTAAAADNVAFLATGGTGDGSTPDAPIGRLTTALDALDLSRDDATVVLVGEFKQTTFFAYTEEFSGKVTITSVYDGVDYRTRGAKYTVTGQRFMCSGKYVFRDLDFHLLDNYFFVIANHYPVTIDTGVTIKSDGAKFDGKSFGSAFAICGGYQAAQAITIGGAKPQASGSDPVEITVRSGEGITIAAYSRGFANSDFSGASTVTVEGDAKVGTLYIAPVNGVSAGNTETTLNLGGNAQIERLVCSDKPISMKRFVLNWKGGSIGAFDRKAEDTAAEGFTVNYSPTVGRTIAFGVVSSQFDTKNKEGGFAATRTYEAFTDVPENAWFYTYVKTAYEYALANGTGSGKFSPDGSFTVAQALTAAVNIHTAYTGKTVSTAGAANWYDPYVNYCVANNIITAGQFDKYDREITRGEMAIVFANILPEAEYKAIRTYTLTDMNDTLPSAAAVKKLAEAGIVGGSNGQYKPNDPIKRSEACVIFTRIAVSDMRDAKAN